MRYSLKQGERLVLSNKNYVIDDVIGEGANCIVYDAHVLEDEVRVRIKELYPASAQIERHRAKLQWKSEEEKRTEAKRFLETYKKNVEIQNKAAFCNVTSQVSGFIEANDTWYMVVDVVNGITFDKDETEKLDETIKTIIALAETIRKYHEQGYVFLDIKPQNFLKISETREYQYACLDVEIGESELLFFRQVESWRNEYENLGTDTSTKRGYLSYYLQDIEASARKYASDRLNEYGKIIVLGNTP